MIDYHLLGDIVVVAVALGFGYAFAKYPDLPGLLKRNILKVKIELEEFGAGGVPDSLKAVYDEAMQEIEAWERALEDDRITWKEARSIGLEAYHLAKAALALIGKG